MKNWYLLFCQTQKFHLVVSRISNLGVCCYYPLESVIYKRSDRPSNRISHKPLFPGYLFVNFDPEIIHTTTITDIPGAHQFIRFSGMPSKVDDSVIHGFKSFQQVRINQEDQTIECINLSEDIANKISEIYLVNDLDYRNILLMRLIESHQDFISQKLQVFSLLSAC